MRQENSAKEAGEEQSERWEKSQEQEVSQEARRTHPRRKESHPCLSAERKNTF